MDALHSWDRRLARIDRHRKTLARRSEVLSRARLATFVATVVLSLLAGVSSDAPLEWVVAGVGAVGFALLVRIQSRIERARSQWTTWRELQARQRARVGLQWDELLPLAHDTIDTSHPFAHDLDLVGPRSLLRSIDTAVSSGGQRRLLDWFLALEPDLAAVRERQERVSALAPRRHFRDRLALTARRELGARRTSWDTEHLLRWIGEERDTKRLAVTTAMLAVMAAVNLGLIAGAIFAGWPAWWGFTVPLYFLGYVISYRSVGHLFEDAGQLEEILAPLHAVLGSLERRRVPEPIEAVIAPLRRTDEHRPATILRRVSHIAWAASLRSNALIWLAFNVPMPWDLGFALRLERTRRELRAHLPVWLDAWHELEALGSLANFADLATGASMPEFVEPSAGCAVLEARALGHPLLRADQRVCNNFAVDELGRVFLVTGSNMSGKSTFLRTVGVNVALANAGSVVLASRMRLVPLRLFTCIQVSDSVNDGISYFYAEVRRLGALVRALESRSGFAQLSLIDEIFRGTNNRERWIGSRAFIEHLVGKRGVVLLSTHDLELAELEKTHAQVKNLHFREEIHERRMVFDYLLREGPCPTTNALVLMEMEGLPVSTKNGPLR